MGKKTDATRAERKAKKRAAEDAVPHLPGDENVEVEVESSEKKGNKRKRDGEENGDVEDKKLKKEKKEKKRKRAEAEAETDLDVKPVQEEQVSKKYKKENKASKEEEPAIEVDTIMGETETEGLPKKSKKERKAERRAAELAAKEAGDLKTEEEASEPKFNGDAKPESEEKKSKKNNRNREKKRKGDSASSTNGDDADKPKDGKPARFIVFVGNLPFTATKESLTAHFAKVHPSSARLLTQKDNPAKCKGCAFVEFDGYDHMKTCLKLMHHSMFDDGLSPARKINVELTAGGGGNTKERKEKIKVKNAKLNEERIRKMHEEEKAKAVKAMEGAKTIGAAIDESAIHPSRRRMVPGAA